MTRLLAILALLASVAFYLAGPAEAGHDPAPTPTPTASSGWTVISLNDGALDVIVVSLLVPR